MIGALAQKAAMPASPLGDLMPPDGTGFSLPTGFAELLGKLGLIGRSDKPEMAAQPKADFQPIVTARAAEEGLNMASVLKMLPPGIAKAFTAPEAVENGPATILPMLPPGIAKVFVTPVEDKAAPIADTDEDDGAVPEGLEEIAKTLAQALATVMAAAGKTVAPKAAADAVTPPARPITLPMATALTLTTPAAPSQATGESATVQDSLARLMMKTDSAFDRAVVKLVRHSDAPATDLPELAADPTMPALTPAIPSITAPAPVTSDGVSASAPLPSASEIVMGHHLDLAKDGEWLDRLARDIARTANHDARLKFQLNPEHLGSLRIELTNAADGTAIRMTADTDAARNILVDAQPRLFAEARAQGLRISESHVDLGHHGSQHGRREDQFETFVRTGQSSEEQAMPSSGADDERYA
jgi:flagellar hook-length control protein FliK